MVLGKFTVPGRPNTAGAGGSCLDILSLICFFFCLFSPTFWKTDRYRLKYCLKKPFNPKQPTNQLLRLSRTEQNIFFIYTQVFTDI